MSELETPVPTGIGLLVLARRDSESRLQNSALRIRRSSSDWMHFGNAITILVAVGGTAGTLAIAGLEVPPAAIIAVAAGAFAAYLLERNLIRSAGDRLNHPKRCVWSDERRVLLACLTCLSLCVLFISMTLLSWRSVLLILAMAGIVLLYFGLRVIRMPAIASAILKSVLVTAAWAIGVAALPMVEAGGTYSAVIALTMYRLVYLFPAVILPDVADLSGDRVSGRRTIAMLAGTRRLSGIVLAAIAALSVVVFGVSTAETSTLMFIDMIGLWIVGLCLVRGAVYNQRFITRTVDVLAAWPAVTYVLSLSF